MYAALQQHCRENERYARDECTGHCLDEIHIFSGRVVSNAATSDRLSLSNNARASKTRSLEKRPFAVISIDGFFRKKNKRFVLSSAILPSILRIIEIRRNTPVEFVYVQFYIPFEFTAIWLHFRHRSSFRFRKTATKRHFRLFFRYVCIVS